MEAAGAGKELIAVADKCLGQEKTEQANFFFSNFDHNLMWSTVTPP